MDGLIKFQFDALSEKDNQKLLLKYAEGFYAVMHNILFNIHYLWDFQFPFPFTIQFDITQFLPHILNLLSQLSIDEILINLSISLVLNEKAFSSSL